MEPTDFVAAASVPDQTRDGYPGRMGDPVMDARAGRTHVLPYPPGWTGQAR